MAVESQKFKLLSLMKIFQEETDEKHGLSMPQIIEKLEDYGVTAERKAIYRDIAALQEFGFDIEKRSHTYPVTYGLKTRLFNGSELTLLADAVQSSRFLTKSKSESLVRKLKSLGSKEQSKDLTRRLYVENRVKSLNESAFAGVNIIQSAIKAKRKIRFHYFKYDLQLGMALQHNGDIYEKTPVQLVYDSNQYYCIVWDDNHENFTNYRVDRMIDLEVSETQATRNERIATFDIEEYKARQFGMFNGEPVLAVLRVNESIMSSIVDRFGKDVTISNIAGHEANISVHVMESPTFFGWLAQFGTDIRIEKPKSLRRSYAKYLNAICSTYDEEQEL